MVLIKASFFVAASVAAFAVSQVSADSAKKLNSSATKSSENDGSCFQQRKIEEEFSDEFNSEVEEEKNEKEINWVGSKMIKETNPKSPKKRDCRKFEFPGLDKKSDNNSEIEQLKNIVRSLKQRKVTVESKLIELRALKGRGQQSYAADLQTQLQIKTKEIDQLNFTLNSLQAERKKLNEEIKQSLLAEKQLQLTKKTFEEMQEEMNMKGTEMKDRLLMIQNQLSSFQKEVASINRDAMAESNLKAVKDTELEAMEMKRRNEELQLEKRELALKLVASHDRITALSNMTVSEVVAKVETEVTNLKHVNEELMKQVEELQNDRFGLIEEVVYQRWLNTCLRFEILRHQNPSSVSSKPGRNTKLSPESKESTKNLVRDFGFESTSSCGTSSAGSSEIDSSTIDSSSSSQTSADKKSNATHNEKRWRRFKDKKSMEPASLRLARRISFSDSVEGEASSTSKNLPETVEVVLDDKEVSVYNMEAEAETIHSNVVETEASCEIEAADTEELHSRMSCWYSNGKKSDQFQMLHLVVAIFFLLAVCVSFLTGGICKDF